MKFAAVLLPALLFASAAHAGSIAFTVTTAAGNVSATSTVPDAGIARMVAAYRTRQPYAEIQDTNADGTPKVDANGQPVMRATTDAEVMKLIMRNALTNMIQTTTLIERDAAISAAAANAAAGVSTITATPQP